MTLAEKTTKPASSLPDLAPVRARIEPLAAANGAELVAIEWTTEGRGFVLRVSVDKAGSAAKKAQTEESAVDLEVCATLSREISRSFDENDPFPTHARYSLEVGSPGVERALRTQADYDRFAGKKAKVRLTNAIGGQKVLEGTINGLEGGVVTFDLGGSTVPVPFAQIASGRLVFEMTQGQKNRPNPGKKTRK